MQQDGPSGCTSLGFLFLTALARRSQTNQLWLGLAVLVSLAAMA